MQGASKADQTAQQQGFACPVSARSFSAEESKQFHFYTEHIVGQFDDAASLPMPKSNKREWLGRLRDYLMEEGQVSEPNKQKMAALMKLYDAHWIEE
ncbi:hypothetical protein [Parendozoicomonas haliclonae]|uniref:Uncharacterized protein n=1 Tax=Parendozoicomonas haliclonae TaxID=1960125 RepID=A0A1X7AJ39_9GAMM|nr:hypothetical protein [Parendozoicomonas haliclonae]SMA40225.1 hypothetical protein EHSB41UT_01157 [Parendozoicomonas haliclonae]